MKKLFAAILLTLTFGVLVWFGVLEPCIELCAKYGYLIGISATIAMLILWLLGTHYIYKIVKWCLKVLGL